MCSFYWLYNCNINDKQIDDAQKLDVVMPMYNLIEYSDAYSKTWGSSWKYYRDEPTLDNNGIIIDFPDDDDDDDDDDTSASFKFKQKIPGQTGNSGTKYVEKIVPLKYLSNFWCTWDAFN